MRLIDSKHPHQYRRDLSADEAAAVRRFCSTGQDVRLGDRTLVEAVLEEMHEGRFVRQWLECDCLPGKDVQPTMTARVSWRRWSPPLRPDASVRRARMRARVVPQES